MEREEPGILESHAIHQPTVIGDACLNRGGWNEDQDRAAELFFNDRNASSSYVDV